MLFYVKLHHLIELYMVYFYMVIIIQVVAESLPVSSSGHLLIVEKIITEKIMPLLPEQYAAQYKMCMSLYVQHAHAVEHTLHGFTALIVALFFYQRWWLLLYNWRRCFFIISKLVLLTAVADVITALFFYAFRVCPLSPPMVSFLLPIGLVVTARLLYSLRWCIPERNRTFDIKSALVLGAVQGLALLPGISRFASVYVASRWLGFNARNGFAVTWMIFWPLVVAASVKGAYQIACSDFFTMLGSHCTDLRMLLAVISGATVLGYIAFVCAARMAYAHRLWQFWWYVFVVALLVLFL